MVSHYTETVTYVHHWNDELFSFRTTRDSGLRFESGQFVTVGLEVNNRPLMRAYSIVSPHYAEELEFFSIKVKDGPLTSRLQHLQVGDSMLVSRKPTGTLVISDLNPGKNLYLLSTGTGLAPFLSLIQDPDTYESFEKVIVVHGVRHVSELAYSELMTKTLAANPYFGDTVQEKLIYYPTVTREEFRNQGRLTDLLCRGKLCRDIGLTQINPETDRVMICGGQSMLNETQNLLDDLGFKGGNKSEGPMDYVIERAFVEM